MKLFIPESEWGNLMTERKQHGMSFWDVLGFEVCFSPYFLTVGDENRERKYQRFGSGIQRGEKSGKFSQRGHSPAWRSLFSSSLELSWLFWYVKSFQPSKLSGVEEKFLTKNASFCTDPSEGRHSPNTASVSSYSVQK